MPSIRSSILIFTCALVAGGCGGAATVFDPSDLRTPSVSRTIRLDEDYSFETRLGGINNVLARVTVLSGRYEAQYEDATGVYFLGPKGCYRTVNVNSDVPGVLADCGIYLPNAQDLAPRIYVYRNEPPQSSDTTSLAAQATPNRAPIVPAAAGAALGAGIVDVMVASDMKKPRFMGEKFQPPAPAFRAKLKTD
jgi:hypothetical protein